MRSLFEICLQKNWAVMAMRMLTLSKVVDKQIWEYEHPFKQCEGLKFEVIQKLEQRGLTVDKLRDLDSKEIGTIAKLN